MNLDYLLDADELGALVVVDGTTLVSYRDGSDVGVKAVDSTAKATLTYEGLELTGSVKNSARPTVWNKVEINCLALPDGSSIEVFYKLDKSGGWKRALMEGAAEKFRARDETQAIFLLGDEAKVFEPRIVCTPTGNLTPEILEAKVFLK